MASVNENNVYFEHYEKHEHGLSGVVAELGSSRLEGSPWISSVACGVMAVIRWANSLHGSLFPHLSLSNEDMIAEFSSSSDWRHGPIRAFSWHPHTAKFALALRDDSVRVYTTGVGIVPTLKHKLQKGVADLAWQPLSASVLAVACQTCVLIWHVDPLSMATRPSTSSVQVLSHPGHGPVTSLAWCPQGGVLVSASPVDTAMMIWDVAMETAIPLRRVGGGGVSMLRWSADGSKLFSGTPSTVFRVWETQTWSCEKWTKLTGRCQAACWSPDGTVLLFATKEEPVIYLLKFTSTLDGTDHSIGGSKVAVSSVDLSVVELENEDGPQRFGGCVQTMAWDPSGERLAVQFKGENSDLIALFRTRVSPVFEIMPCGIVRGEEGAEAQMIAFQPTFERQGALLSVVWSTGQVSFIPLFFLPSSAVITDRPMAVRTSNGQMENGFLHTHPGL
ncbi:aladin [Lingula anatina]|uniref:Aladin n=1 Tax=Lingula anatina TaxID=7574 RepID=A0A1S3ILL5_LINAN|nr:aladin [Lingula anatina]|eukprot:XP_013399135.1 aladin [Lingula anatina]